MTVKALKKKNNMKPFKLRSGNKPSIAKLSGISPMRLGPTERHPHYNTLSPEEKEKYNALGKKEKQRVNKVNKSESQLKNYLGGFEAPGLNVDEID